MTDTVLLPASASSADQIEATETIAPLPTPPLDLLNTPTSSLTESLISQSLALLTDNQALETCVTLLTSHRIDDHHITRSILESGLERGQAGLAKADREVRALLEAEPSGSATSGFGAWSKEKVRVAVDKVSENDFSTEVVLRCSAVLRSLKQRLETFDIICPPASHFASKAETDPEGIKGDVGGSSDGADIEIDDPWVEDTEDQNVPETILDDPWETTTSEKSLPTQEGNGTPILEELPSITPPIDLSTFLVQPLPASAVFFATSAALHVLRIVFDRHGEELFPYRFVILDALPLWVSAAELDEEGLLPAVGDEGRERPWKADSIGNISVLDYLPQRLFPQDVSTVHELAKQPDLLSSAELCQWYTSRVSQVDTLGLLDVQIAWVQHGAALGIPNLDALGEDLSLLSRLIYDAHLTPTQNEHWNLSTWASSSPATIVKAYLSNSTPETIVGDIKRLVLPYLYVLESRAERAGQSDPTLIERFLHDAILSLPLRLALPVFESSKATLPATERLVKNDLNVARLALACLYGSDQRDVWGTMSSIFECLPVWDVSGGDVDSDKEATSTTLESIATFVRPTVTKPRPPTPSDLYIFFSPLPFASLSRALDILDVHLESGEILARWEVGVQLRFLLQSSRDGKEQMELAEKMVRRQAAKMPVSQTEQKWGQLWGDMLKLNGGDDALLRGAFGMLSVDEMMRIYLGGLLSSGKFDVAKKVIRKLEIEHGLRHEMVEDVVLTTSREFYMNAETGNIHTGDMKLAYDCLAVAPQTTPIRLERDFIEATSRLVSFKSLNSQTPIEIRHTRDKLSLISKLLTSSDDAFRHTDLILELADKLGGYQGDQRKVVEVLGMLADSSIGQGDFERGFELCQRVFGVTKTILGDSQRKYRKRISLTQPSIGQGGGGEEEKEEEKEKEKDDRLKEITWKTCLSLGQQSEYPEISNKLILIGHAVELCPAESIPDVLRVFRKVEEGQMKLTTASKRRREAGIGLTGSTSNSPVVTQSPVSGMGRNVEERVLGSRTAARAARLALDLGATFNLRMNHGGASLGGTPISGAISSFGGSRSSSVERGNRDEDGGGRRTSGESERLNEADRVSRQAKRALAKGVGWLLGADEVEMGISDRD